MLGIEPHYFDGHDIHLHVPAGAGPQRRTLSAGITMTTALASLATQRPVRNDLAMTGKSPSVGRYCRSVGSKTKYWQLIVKA
jgi:ATP-dependent Lon protease